MPLPTFELKIKIKCGMVEGKDVFQKIQKQQFSQYK